MKVTPVATIVDSWRSTTAQVQARQCVLTSVNVCDHDKIDAMSVVAKPRRDTDRFRALYHHLAALSRASSLEAVYEGALTSLLEASAADRSVVLLFDEDGVIRPKASRGLSDQYLAAITGYSQWPRGTLGAHFLVVPDILADESVAALRDALRREEIRTLAFVPLALGAGVIGNFMLCYAEPHECTTDEVEIADTIAAQVALATELKRAELARARSEQRLQALLDHPAVTSSDADLAERRQLEAASQHLAAIVESSDDAIISKNLDGLITSWNHGAERIFGYTAPEIVGKPVSTLTAPDRLDEMPQILSKIKKGLRIEQYETRRRRKDGQIIDVALTVSPVRNASGQIVGASKIARDITDRKRAEAEHSLLLAREQEARRTAELLNRVATRLSVQLDLEKLVQEVTDLATALVGAEFGSLFHKVTNEKGETCVLHTVSGVPADALTAFPMPQSPDLFEATFHGEHMVRCDDLTQDSRYGANLPPGIPKGELLVRSYLAAPVVARSGEVLGGLFFGHSLPGRFTEAHAEIVTGIAAQASIAMDNARLFEQTRWVQEELKRSNEELRLANRDLEIFAYSASHDLQEPLRTISISAQIIERDWGQRLQGQDALFLGNILTASQRMGVLLEDLLTYTRSTRYEEGPAPNVDSASVLATVLETLQGPIQEAAAQVTTAALPIVAIHESRLAQLFQNLISNAIKYRNKEVPRVHITAVDRDGWCVFSVADNGIGIDSRFAEQIFGLFKRLHGRDQYPGSGIGLAICQRVVEQYGGRIWLEKSVPGGGSTFSFALPSRTR
jgi:PAS domain S-box-containing protein